MVKLFLLKTIKKPWVRFQIRQHQPMLLNQLARLEGGWNASEYNIIVTEKVLFYRESLPQLQFFLFYSFSKSLNSKNNCAPASDTNNPGLS